LTKMDQDGKSSALAALGRLEVRSIFLKWYKFWVSW
jgi:hypothetical protein